VLNTAGFKFVIDIIYIIIFITMIMPVLRFAHAQIGFRFVQQATPA